MKGLGLAAVLVATVWSGAATAQSRADWRTVSPDALWVIDTTKGRVLVELDPQIAPRHVERIQTLTNRGFYDGHAFHRVIRGFMAQTGDPEGTGQGGSDLPDLAAELTFRRGRDAPFVPVATGAAGLRGIFGTVPVTTQPDAQMMVTADFRVGAGGLFCPGVAGMARSNSLDSANSQFFLMTGQNDALNGGYTVFGRVVDGLEVVEALNAGPEDRNGAVEQPDRMTRARLASALPEAERPVVRVLNPRSDAFAEHVERTRAERGTAFGICDVQPVVQVTGG